MVHGLHNKGVIIAAGFSGLSRAFSVLLSLHIVSGGIPSTLGYPTDIGDSGRSTTDNRSER